MITLTPIKRDGCEVYGMCDFHAKELVGQNPFADMPYILFAGRAMFYCRHGMRILGPCELCGPEQIDTNEYPVHNQIPQGVR